MSNPSRVDETLLTPLLYLERSAQVFGGHIAIVHGSQRITYQDMADHATRLARALEASGIGPGDRVAYLCPNIPQMLIAHFGVPLAKAVLVAINTRLSGPEIAYILSHSGAKALVVDTELLPAAAPHLGDCPDLGEVITIDELGIPSEVDSTSYEDFLARGSIDPLPWRVDDEFRTISINYTSGTTGRPKGVMYTHRGAYLNAMCEVVHSGFNRDSVYLWTLPMFHCNGWCTTWGVTAVGGRHVCLRAVRPDQIWSLIESEGISHLNGAPTVLVGMANHPSARRLDAPLTVTTAGAPPSPTIIGQMEELGARVVHVYGLTETYGPYTVCETQADWARRSTEERARLMARQGVAMVGADPIRVVDAQMNDLPRDGETMGEVVMRGNIVMSGYYDNPAATEEAFRGGWFHSGDLAVWHPDGYIELRDRAKDIIISGGENISTIEVEQAVVSHPAVLEGAVVAMPHEYWGERPKAYVVLKEGQTAEPGEIITHVRDCLAHFKAPDVVEIMPALPKTSTGKVQKYVLRQDLWERKSKKIN
ncbi:MAG: long-chain-fatty-acid--CoA ligase [Actinomycetia bacterium]|nr:long-chain-fatty-acid--CoA ligase [Actinomycetes bacterium]